jgi:hypothetical protein
MVPGAFTKGANHFAHSGKPSESAVWRRMKPAYAGVADKALKGLASLEPAEADPARWPARSSGSWTSRSPASSSTPGTPPSVGLFAA